MVETSQDLLGKLARIKLLAMDVDGVLTDAGMYYSEHGDELKKFNTRDGKGIELLRHAGIKTAFITGEKTKLLERRAAKLKVDELCQGAKDKLSVLKEVMSRHGLTCEEVAYIGDDVIDLEVMQAVGLSFTVADGLPDNKRVADYVTQAKGGEGAVREVAVLILDAKNQKKSEKRQSKR
jgi:YrbI family 3-deoxy-D-manno-octulosonate 8-phosphate phosphatase